MKYSFFIFAFCIFGWHCSKNNSNVPALDTVNFKFVAQDFYTKQPLTNRKIQILDLRGNPQKNLPSFQTDGNGEFTGQLEYNFLGSVVVFDDVTSDNYLYIGYLKLSKSQAPLNIVQRYKKYTKSSLQFSNPSNDTLAITLNSVICFPQDSMNIKFWAANSKEYGFVSSPIVFSLKPLRDTTITIRSLPEEETFINYSYIRLSKPSLKATVSEYIQTSRADTFAYKITF